MEVKCNYCGILIEKPTTIILLKSKFDGEKIELVAFKCQNCLESVIIFKNHFEEWN